MTEGKSKEVLCTFKAFLEIRGGQAEKVGDVTIDRTPAFIAGVEKNFRGRDHLRRVACL